MRTSLRGTRRNQALLTVGVIALVAALGGWALMASKGKAPARQASSASNHPVPVVSTPAAGGQRGHRTVSITWVGDMTFGTLAAWPPAGTGSLLAHVRRGDVVRVHALRRGAAEALEAIVHGDERSSRVIGRTVGEIPLPEGASIGAIVRADEVIMAHHDTRVLADDHVILFLADRRHLEAVERLFLRATR